MRGIATYTPNDSLPVLRTSWLYTVSRLLKNPHAKVLAPGFQALGPAIDAAIIRQRDLDDANLIAAAGRDGADDALDPLVGQIVNALLIVTRNDRDDPLYVSYIGAQTPTEIVRPLLGDELATVAEWVAPLQQESEPLLQAFAAPLAEVVGAGQTAENEVKATDKALSDFRLVGERKKLVDTFNAARGSLFGALVKLQHENSTLRLPSDWAESFFQRSVKTSKYGATVAQAKASLARLADETTVAQENLAELTQKETEREEARAKRTQARAALAASRKAGKEQRQEEKALEALAKKKLR